MRAKTNGGQPPDTGIVGFYDYLNNPTQYKCRETQYMRQHGAEIEFGCKNLMQRLDSLYKAYAPKYHQLQEEAIAPEFRMYETVFSTITVNHNFRTAVHVDKGDFRSGLAALVVIGGAFSGCDLAVKKMKKRFPLRTGDVLFFDTSLEHGNTEVHDPEQGWERISVVCYYRTGLSSQTCQTERRRYLNRYLDGRLRQGGFTDVVNINEGDSRLAPLYVPWRLRERLASVQLAALNFASERLSKNTGSIIALTMGLGKTLVALTLCFSFLQQNPDKDILIVAPKQVIAHWRDEYEKWRSLGLFFRYFIASDGSQSQRQFFEESLNRYKMKMLTETHTEGYIFVLNSEYLQSFTSRFDKFRPSLIIVDEGHMMASKSGKLTDLLDQFGGLHVALTGTPLQNETEDLYRLVCWVNKTVRQTFSPQAFQKHSAFITQYITGKHSNLDAAARAQKILLEWMSTYVFREMEAELPPRYDYIIVCNNSVQQAKLLERIGATGETVTAATEHRPSLLTAHPICYVSYMMGRFNTDAVKREREEKKSPEEWKNLSDDRETTLEWRNSVAAGLVEPFVHASGKMTALVEIVRHAVALDQKVIIFSHYIATQDTILRVLLALKVKTLSMRSRDTYDRRQSVIDKFKATDSEHISVMVLSTKLAAFGLDFSMANHVVLFDSWWNPQVDSQAIARSYRRNQEHEVVVYRLATLPTDRSILRTQARKNALFNCIMREQEIQQTSHDSLENCEETEPDEGRKRLWSKLKNDIVLQGNTDKAVSAVYRC
ncbi:DNA repair and recombination protein RAD54B [Angomonas deanei]|nr:DNA repair and recombination protein RAD54B [Angomonas deanei]|eukprot:EPY28945.1 DNA repair and recombination protein RAD54B [Angomonas deanei]